MTSFNFLNRALVALYKGYYYGHLGKPSGEPSDTPQMVAGHVPEARARSI